MAEPKPILTEISPGELLDKITVLEIKKERIKDAAKLNNIGIELAILEGAATELPDLPELRVLTDRLKKENEVIWDQGDELRRLDRAEDYGEKFTTVSLEIHRSNDKRAQTKKEINLLLGSRIIEEKSYDELT